jgi:LPXTG-motif cell wall-anchored protein
VASQDAGPTLPATGFPAGVLAGMGALMLAAGTTLRRRVS